MSLNSCSLNKSPLSVLKVILNDSGLSGDGRCWLAGCNSDVRPNGLALMGPVVLDFAVAIPASVVGRF